MGPPGPAGVVGPTVSNDVSKNRFKGYRMKTKIIFKNFYTISR